MRSFGFRPSIQLEECKDVSLNSQLIDCIRTIRKRRQNERRMFVKRWKWWQLRQMSRTKWSRFLKPTDLIGIISLIFVLTESQQWLGPEVALLPWWKKNFPMWHPLIINCVDTLSPQRLCLRLWWKQWRTWSISFGQGPKIIASFRLWPKKWRRSMWGCFTTRKYAGFWDKNAQLGYMSCELRWKSFSRTITAISIVTLALKGFGQCVCPASTKLTYLSKDAKCAG